MSFVFLPQGFAENLRARISAYALSLLRAEADKFLLSKPYSVTAVPGRAGDRHAYYSEAPYWWPQDGDADAPYVRRDGQVYPGRFTAHEHAMFRMCDESLLLSQAGYFLNDRSYAEHAARMLDTWFLNPDTRMTPHLKYAQAIRGVCDGRFIGLIDSTALINVVHAAGFLAEMGFDDTVGGLRAWFEAYLHWLLTDEESQKERLYGNNHALWYNAQSAAFAAFTGHQSVLLTLADEFKTRLLPQQMDARGAFFHELERTRSYMYANFALEACALTAQAMSISQTDDLWHFTLPDGRGLRLGAAFMADYVENPFLWTYPQLHAEYMGEQASLQLAAAALDAPELQNKNRAARVNASLFAHPCHIGALCLLPGYGEI